MRESCPAASRTTVLVFPGEDDMKLKELSVGQSGAGLVIKSDSYHEIHDSVEA